MDHSHFMTLASQLAITHMQKGEGGPFGAVIVKDGVVIAEGWNRVLATCDPTAHAEIVAIRRASERLQSFHLEGCILYTSCEPCPMCLAAIYWAHIEKVYYANTREDAARIGFDDKKIYQEIALPPQGRSLPLHAIPCSDAGRSFELWQQKQDKVGY